MLAETYLPEKFEVGRVRAEYRNAAVLGDVLYPMVYKQNGCVTVALNDVSAKPYAVIQFIAK